MKKNTDITDVLPKKQGDSIMLLSVGPGNAVRDWKGPIQHDTFRYILDQCKLKGYKPS